MKIAITADLHLRTKEQTQDQYATLEWILNELPKYNCNILLCAGDTFNKEYQNYQDFMTLLAQYPKIKVIIIPGNHDADIDSRYFHLDNIKVVTKPTILQNMLSQNSGIPILIFPYMRNKKTLDEEIGEYFQTNRKPEQWVLVSHADFLTMRHVENPYEKGSYMPLTRKVLERYQPLKVFLGHIHAPTSLEDVIYPGSPYPLDINETGKRRFILYNTTNNEVESIDIPTKKIFMKETIISFPLEGEEALIKKQIDELIAKWNLTPEEIQRVYLRANVVGFTTDVQTLKKIIHTHIRSKGIQWYDENGPDVSKVSVVHSIDDERSILLNKVKDLIENCKFEDSTIKATKEQILEQVLQLIYA